MSKIPKTEYYLIKSKLTVIKTQLSENSTIGNRTDKQLLLAIALRSSQEPINRASFLHVSAYRKRSFHSIHKLYLFVYFLLQNPITTPPSWHYATRQNPSERIYISSLQICQNTLIRCSPTFCNIFMQFFCWQFFVQSCCLRSVSYSGSLS